MGNIWDIALRATQIISAFVVLGLSADLVANKFQLQPTPFILVWATFAGAVSVLISIVGLASNWYESLEGKGILFLDGLMVLLNFAGSILIAIGLKGIKCSLEGIKKVGERIPDLLLPKIDCDNKGRCSREQVGDKVINRCSRSKADEALMFFTAAVFLATFALGWLRLRRGR